MYLKKIAVSLLVLSVFLSVGLIPHSEARANQDMIASLELNFGKVNKVTKIDFQVEGLCESVVAVVQYDSDRLRFRSYKSFWKDTKVFRIEKGTIRIEAQTEYPVPRRSQVLQLRFVPCYPGKTELRIQRVRGRYQGRSLNIVHVEDGKIWALP